MVKAANKSTTNARGDMLKHKRSVKDAVVEKQVKKLSKGKGSPNRKPRKQPKGVSE